MPSNQSQNPTGLTDTSSGTAQPQNPATPPVRRPFKPLTMGLPRTPTPNRLRPAASISPHRTCNQAYDEYDEIEAVDPVTIPDQEPRDMALRLPQNLNMGNGTPPSRIPPDRIAAAREQASRNRALRRPGHLATITSTGSPGNMATHIDRQTRQDANTASQSDPVQYPLLTYAQTRAAVARVQRSLAVKTTQKRGTDQQD